MLVSFLLFCLAPLCVPAPLPQHSPLPLQHELVVRAEGGGVAVMSLVQVKVVDVNDNPPHFLEEEMTVTVVEEDDSHLPANIFKVSENEWTVKQNRNNLWFNGRGGECSWLPICM